MATRRNRKRGGGWFKSTPKKVLKAYPGSGYNNNYNPSFPPSNNQEVSKQPSKAYPGSGYNNNYNPSFPPSNGEYWREDKPEVSKIQSKAYPGSGYNNNYIPSSAPSNGEYWREEKPEVSKYKSLFNKLARGKTRKNAFGRGPNAQIASKIRSNNIHKASKHRR